MPGAHRHGDSRFCGATTKVIGQNKVTVNGKLWAVEGDIDTHCDQGSLSAVYGPPSIKINDKYIICGVGDVAAPDKLACFIKHPTGATNPLGHSVDVLVYGGKAGGGK